MKNENERKCVELKNWVVNNDKLPTIQVVSSPAKKIGKGFLKAVGKAKQLENFIKCLQLKEFVEAHGRFPVKCENI